MQKASSFKIAGLLALGLSAGAFGLTSQGFAAPATGSTGTSGSTGNCNGAATGNPPQTNCEPKTTQGNPGGGPTSIGNCKAQGNPPVDTCRTKT
jgi:hypothetical protein